MSPAEGLMLGLLSASAVWWVVLALMHHHLTAIIRERCAAVDRALDGWIFAEDGWKRTLDGWMREYGWERVRLRDGDAYRSPGGSLVRPQRDEAGEVEWVEVTP